MPESKRRKPKSTGPTPSRSPSVTKKDPSPRWYVYLMAGLMGVGVLVVLLRFMVFQESEWLLLAGLLFITVGFVMTTNYR
jgi:hypothetical protein